MILTYDGSQYHGWQRQHNGITIQEVIEEKIETMVGVPVKLIASGRTDAGVHAINQVCNFKSRSSIDPEAIKRGLNSLLPDDIFVKVAEYVPADFHARYSANSKVYEYRILNREDPDVFLRHYLWHIRTPLNNDEMAKCLSTLKGAHDFSSFRSSGSGNTNPVRSISRAELHGPDANDILRIVIEADGFLRHMVRNIVGTVVEAGLGKINVDRFREILESKDRQLAGIKAPAQGLFLVVVRY
ncbi:MAG: tRNA pseudouridine(38-40) synthase TruA [Deltaproteobacteria bacterium]|nr:tRNA pseudouridine(38-40) synthase TruA [Deltaproteobacteria bacterium]